MRKRADWSRSLPRPLVIPTVMTLKTLADVRELMRHLPKDRRNRSTWRHVAAQLEQAAPAPTRSTSPLRCAWRCRWRTSSAARSEAAPVPAAVVRRGALWGFYFFGSGYIKSTTHCVNSVALSEP
jgi:hypothetical protein